MQISFCVAERRRWRVFGSSITPNIMIRNLTRELGSQKPKSQHKQNHDEDYEYEYRYRCCRR